MKKAGKDEEELESFKVDEDFDFKYKKRRDILTTIEIYVIAFSLILSILGFFILYNIILGITMFIITFSSIGISWFVNHELFMRVNIKFNFLKQREKTKHFLQFIITYGENESMYWIETFHSRIKYDSYTIDYENSILSVDLEGKNIKFPLINPENANILGKIMDFAAKENIGLYYQPIEKFICIDGNTEYNFENIIDIFLIMKGEFEDNIIFKPRLHQSLSIIEDLVRVAYGNYILIMNNRDSAFLIEKKLFDNIMDSKKIEVKEIEL